MLFGLKSSGPNRPDSRPHTSVRPPTARIRVHVNLAPGPSAYGSFSGIVNRVIGPLVDFPFHALRQLSVLAGLAVAAIRPTVRRFVVMEIAVRLDHPASFQAQNFKTLGSQRVRRNPARSSRAHHDHVVDFLCRQISTDPLFNSSKSFGMLMSDAQDACIRENRPCSSCPGNPAHQSVRFWKCKNLRRSCLSGWRKTTKLSCCDFASCSATLICVSNLTRCASVAERNALPNCRWLSLSINLTIDPFFLQRGLEFGSRKNYEIDVVRYLRLLAQADRCSAGRRCSAGEAPWVMLDRSPASHRHAPGSGYPLWRHRLWVGQ